ncbi:hypothetical protein [Mesobacterium pallidum]|uniref:hypothetical protein n=1 Tax=Mesobacterium pallidum TaxID=2872037 RepID=UPI001EE292BB|nr:hypothetical protein [Mesobacterium pallidum]
MIVRFCSLCEGYLRGYGVTLRMHARRHSVTICGYIRSRERFESEDMITVSRESGGFLVTCLSKAGEVEAKVRFDAEADAWDFAQTWGDWVGAKDAILVEQTARPDAA